MLRHDVWQRYLTTRFPPRRRRVRAQPHGFGPCCLPPPATGSLRCPGQLFRVDAPTRHARPPPPCGRTSGRRSRHWLRKTSPRNAHRHGAVPQATPGVASAKALTRGASSLPDAGTRPHRAGSRHTGRTRIRERSRSPPRYDRDGARSRRERPQGTPRRIGRNQCIGNAPSPPATWAVARSPPHLLRPRRAGTLRSSCA